MICNGNVQILRFVCLSIQILSELVVSIASRRKIFIVCFTFVTYDVVTEEIDSSVRSAGPRKRFYDCDYPVLFANFLFFKKVPFVYRVVRSNVLE